MVWLDQPYRNYAVDLLSPQHYPKDGSEPYDDVSWELPVHYRLEAIPTADASVRAAAITSVSEVPHPAGKVNGDVPVLLMKDIGRPAILDLPAGHGHVVAFNFNPIHRDLNHGDQRLVWNAILNWQAILKGQL